MTDAQWKDFIHRYENTIVDRDENTIVDKKPAFSDHLHEAIAKGQCDHCFQYNYSEEWFVREPGSDLEDLLCPDCAEALKSRGIPNIKKLYY